MGKRKEQTRWMSGTPDPVVQKFTSSSASFEELMSTSRGIPEEVNAIRNWNVAGSPNPQNVLSWFRNDQQVVFYGPGNDNKDPLSYAELQDAVKSFAPAYNTKKAKQSHDVMVVGLLLPPRCLTHMAVALITLLNQHSEGIAVAPLDPSMPRGKLLHAIEQLQCSALVTSKELYYENLSKEQYIAKRIKDIRLVETDALHPGTGAVSWTVISNGSLTPVNFSGITSRPALLLRTSGTTAEPRIVPITASALLYNATCLASTLRLKRSDIGINATPLHHIGGMMANIFAVLVSGSSMILVPTTSFDPDVFLDVILGEGHTNNDALLPTWYTSVPAIHKVLLMTAKARLAAASSATATSKKQRFMSKHNLRMIRNGGAHLSQTTALELASVFQTPVVQTYAMTECLPIASNHDAPIMVDPDNGAEVLRAGVPKDTVGRPFGVSVSIVDSQGKPLPYGTVGEICLHGPGVVEAYVGVPKSQSHTYDGLFRTGDLGQMDKKGQIVLSGRSRELIKRGMEQIWPNEIDAVIESFSEVDTAISFGVPNDLWGEEVQAIVVLQDPHMDKIGMSSMIARAVEEHVGAYAKPSQVLFLESTEALFQTSSGKVLRNRIAEQLEVEAMDVSALQALGDMARPYDDMMNSHRRRGEIERGVENPSKALNGLRFMAASYVVMHHAGLMPRSDWLRAQAYTASAMIFFVLAAFQTTVTTKSDMKSNAARFIGTKIGALHAFFIVAHIIAIASYLVFQCGENGYSQKFEGKSCTDGLQQYLPIASLNMLTGFFTKEYFDPSNPPAWFQTTLYLFYLFFPIFDGHIRNRSPRYRIGLFVVCMILGSCSWLLNYSENGQDLVTDLYFYERFVSWVPNLIAAMIAGYFYKAYGPRKVSEEDETEDYAPQRGKKKKKIDDEEIVPMLQRPGFWGCITDVVSILLLFVSLAVSEGADCIQITREFFKEARPGIPIFDTDITEVDGIEYVEACDVTRDEFIKYGWTSEINNGTWPSDLAFIMGDGRFVFPLILLWIYGMAYGRGCTASLFSLRITQFLAPYAYPLYLLHVPVLRFYWIATRGGSARFWWDDAGRFPFPIEVWEVYLVIFICLFFSMFVNFAIVRRLMPISIAVYVRAYEFLVSCLSPQNSYSGVGEITASPSVFKQVSTLVESLTGNQQLTSSTQLEDLGFHSLGAAALLGTLRATVPSAKDLNMGQLASCETVGDLIFLLEGRD